MTRNNGKKPKKRVTLPPKSARAGGDPESFLQETPVWKIDQFDEKGPWGSAGVVHEHIWEHIFPKLKDYESMTWADIDRNKWYNHFISVAKIIKEAQSRLLEKKIDIDELFRFRLGGKGRLWGIRDGKVFKVLWWDPEHQIYPYELKNT